MKLFISIIVALIVSGLIGWIVYLRTGLETASYIVGVIALAVAVVGVVIPFFTPAGKWIKSKVKAQNITDSTVAGVVITRKDEPGQISANVDAKDVKKSKVIGVEEK